MSTITRIPNQNEISTRFASPNEQVTFVERIKQARKDHSLYAGLPGYADLESAEGTRIVLIVPPGDCLHLIQQAGREARQERDVASIEAVMCPTKWFMLADGKQFSEDTVHDYVVAHGYGAPTASGMRTAERMFWKGVDYATIAFEVVARQQTMEQE